MSEVLLKAENVSIVFGGLKAVSDFDFYINKGELIGLIGPNGAGKTTAFNLITGVYQPTTGSIEFAGKSIVGKKPYEITQRGIARTFQNIRLFSELTVLDNVKIAFHSHVKYGLAETVFRVGRYFSEEKQIEEESMKLLKSSSWMVMLMTRPKICLMVLSAVWRLPGPWQPSQSCCFWMSRQQV